MKLGGLGTTGRDFRALFEGGSAAGLTDEELLARFSTRRGDPLAEAAFAALVARHGPMVWGTCRRILRDPHAAEDAFQATFLVLVRKARSVRVEDSLGRWLHGVVVRVALRAKAVEARRSGAPLSVVEPSTPDPDADLNDLRSAIDEEVDRLPSAYRSVVILCHLEGLTRERAASRLGCPVGTVNSRLSRASDLLRTRLTRRGLAPGMSGIAVLLSVFEVSAAVPTRLVGSTVETSARLASGGTLAGVAPASVVSLAIHYFRGKLMIKMTMAMALLVGFASMGSIGLAERGEGSKEEPRAQVTTPKPVPPSLDERVKATKAEWDAARAKYFEEKGKAKTDAERADVEKLNPEILRYASRFLSLAETDLDSPAARDALLWIIEQYWISDGFGEWGNLRGRAMDLLVEHHADDLKVAWACLSMDRYTSPNRDKFIPALYEKAKNKRAKGAVTLALARYRRKMSESSFGRKLEAPQVYKNELGEVLTMHDELLAYDKVAYERDPAPLRAEAFRLLDEVIRDHADEPYDSKKGTTLGQKARDLFDEWANLAVGKPAPDFEGKDLEGKPLKLSDYRGKVVVLAFWASWCGPCLRQIPAERDLAERLKGRPFAFLGVNCDENTEAARTVVRDQRVAWTNAVDSSRQVGPCEVEMGPIARRYHVSRLPSVFILDADGAIRHKNAGGESLEKFVEELLKEIEPKPAGSK